MQNVKDIDLDRMSVRELLDLQAELHTAIRAQIRKRSEEKAAATTRTTAVSTTGAAATPAQPSNADLERERDAWLARRRSGTG